MKTYRINYRNADLKHSSVERLKKDLKDLYWAEAPANWDQFDDDFEFKGQQDRGGDCVELIVSENMRDGWVDSIISELNKKRNIRKIELKNSDEYVSID